MAWAWCGRWAPWRDCSPACGGASRGDLERWLRGGRRGGWEARRRQRRSWRRPEAAAWPALRGSLVASPRLDSRAWSGTTLGSSDPEVAPLDPFAGSCPAVWGLLVRHEWRRWSYGSSSCQDEDLPEALLHGSGRSGVFRKAPPANSTGRSCPEIAGSDEIRSGAPTFLFDRLVSEGALRSSADCFHHATWFLIPWWG
jgi:hypothetical protein